MLRLSFLITNLLFGLAFIAECAAQNPITWSTSTPIAPAASGNEHPRLVINGKGQPLIVWHHAGRCMFSRWNGSAFTAPILLHPGTMTVAGASWMGPDIAAHGDTVYVVFKQTPESSSNAHIYCVRSFNGGESFSPPTQVDQIADSLSRFPTVTTDKNGLPVVGFMKFNPTFGESRWATTRSFDFGATFQPDIKASGWSNPNSTVCDCCPGAIAAEGSTVAMVYRDNNDNIRDSWAGISTDDGLSFTAGLGVDLQQWQIFACPATGPDAVIVGDTLYSTFANGASGKSLVYFNQTDLITLSNPVSQPLSSNTTGVSQQNYPRIATDGRALGIAWVQTLNGTRQCVLRFTNDIGTGLPAAYEVVDEHNNTNCDIAIDHGKVYVVWEDDATGTIQFRQGQFAIASSTDEPETSVQLSVAPSPTSGLFTLSCSQDMESVQLFDALGRRVLQTAPNSREWMYSMSTPGWYYALVRAGGRILNTTFCVR